MKATFGICILLVGLVTILVQATPNIPDDLPESLKEEAQAVRKDVQEWRRANPDATWCDMPKDLRERMEDIKDKYEDETGKPWPRPNRRRGGNRRRSGVDDIDDDEE